MRAGRALGIPAVVWIRGEEEYRLGRSRVHRMLSPRVWAAARGVLVQSDQNRLVLLRELERYAPAVMPRVRDKLDVVPNGLDLPGGPFAPGSGVLGAGRLIDDKAFDVLVRATAGVAPLTLAGDGPERAALEALARETGADVTFTGFAGRAELAERYRDAGCFVLASRRGEGLPNVLLEAMAWARPVIATPCAGSLDLVVDGVNGLLVPADDPAAMRAAILRVRGDAAFASRLGAEARRTVERFAWDTATARLEAVLARWISQAGAA